MVYPHELRIGNLVLAPNLWKKQFFYVMELYARECSVSPDVQNQSRIISYQALEPIQLSWTLLEEFGFSQVTEMEESYILVEQGKHRVYLTTELRIVKSPAQPVELTDYPLTHVHQLQNLFFTVAGEELSILASQRCEGRAMG